MAVDPANFAMGPADLYVGDFGAAEPLPTQVNGTPAASAWDNPGATLGGIRFVETKAFKELECDQLVETVERRVTKKEVTLATQFAEVTFANMVLAMNGGTVSSGTGYEMYEPAEENSGTAQTYKAVILDGTGGSGLRRRIVIRKVLSTENVETAHGKEDQTVIPATFTSHRVSSSTKSWYVVNATA